MKWYIEEISTDSTSESSFIVVYPDVVVMTLQTVAKPCIPRT